MRNPTRRRSSRQSHLFSATAVDAALLGWSTTRHYQQPVVELVGDGMPGEILLRIRDDAGIEPTITFALTPDGDLRVSDFSLSVWAAAEIDAELRAWWWA